MNNEKTIASGFLISLILLAFATIVATMVFIVYFSYTLGRDRGHSESRRAVEVVGKIDDCIAQDGEPKLEVEFGEEYNNGYFLNVECNNLY